MFYVVALEGCPYSESCVNKLKKLNIKHNVTWVNHNTKHQYKTSKFNTFPQISFKVINRQGIYKDIFIGGLDDSEKLIQISNVINKVDLLKYLQNNNMNKQLVAPILFLMKKK
jgi:glutaredoxin